MLDIGVDGLDPDAFQFEDVDSDITHATTLRIFAIAQAMQNGTPLEDIHEMSRIDRWFLHGVKEIIDMQRTLREAATPLDETLLRQAKEDGFTDATIDRLTGSTPGETRRSRKELDIIPGVARIDTTAAEFPAETNYLYSSYKAHSSETSKVKRRKIMVLGSGPYRIGSSVEFDWCCVNAIEAAAEQGFETIMLNCNPETVSTDYDICDRLVFDEVSLETVLDLCELEQPEAVVVSMGGQLPNNLALGLHEAGIKILGTSAESIDRAEDRSKFGAMLDELGVDQPKWAHLTRLEEAEGLVHGLGGYPVLVRPSYVLSGAAMSVAHDPHELERILGRALEVTPEHPVVVSKFETHAREVEIDAVADDGRLILWAISEHVENAGVHSGDATLVLPPQTLYIETIRRVKKIAAEVARELAITGPFNMQFLARRNDVKVIECNLRASRSFPFVSKATGSNFVAEATRRMLGVRRPVTNNSLDLDFVAVKAPQFSFDRLSGADPILGVEMASTGEVGCFGDDIHEALLHAMIASGFRLPKKGVLLSLGPIEEKYTLVDQIRMIADELKLPIYATEGTSEALTAIGIPCHTISKHQANGNSAMHHIDEGDIDLVINIPREYDEQGRPDGYLIRRRAVEAEVPLITDLQLARALIEALRRRESKDLGVSAWQDFMLRNSAA